MTRIFGVTGWKNSGKTTLVARLVTEFTRRGFTVSTVKHASDNFQLDRPGTDTFAHREAGAREIAIASGRSWAIIHQNDDTEEEMSLDGMVSKLEPCDLVLVEGYKSSTIPKIETIRREAVSEPPVWQQNKSIVAIASDGPVETGSLSRFQLDDIEGITDFISEKTGLGI